MTLSRFAVLLLAASCSLGATSPAAVRIGDGDLRVLFVGNSLTYTNDLPALTAQLAALSGHSLATGTLAFANASLEDHAARDAYAVIRRERPDVIVLQQGPSSLPESREHLVHWARQFAAVAAEVGSRPALLMVWPSSDRMHAFDAVRDSYAAAASAVDGAFIPAGESWRAAWRRDPALPFFAQDGFHPSELGTLAAALTIHAVLWEQDATTFACPSAETLRVSAASLATVCAGVLEAVTEARALAARGGTGGR